MAENKKVAVIATKGNLEDAYPPLNIAVAAAASGADVAIFFTFEGLKLIHKQADEIVQPSPGKEMIRDALAKHGIPKVSDLIEMAKESGVRLIACQMTCDVLGMPAEDLVDGIELAGAAAFLDFAMDANITATF